MKKNNFVLILILASIWITTQSTDCRRQSLSNSCSDFRRDSVLLKMDVVNQATTFTLADTIKVYSKVSDTITPQVSSGFIFPLNSLEAAVQLYKVVPNGSSYQLNYANVEFNVSVQKGIFQPNQSIGYNFLYNRNQPTNELQFSLKPGVVGLYAVVLNKSYYDYNSTIRNPNDNCVSFTNAASFNATKQNLQYWNTLGLTTLSLNGSNNSISINKADRNYFFVKIIP